MPEPYDLIDIPAAAFRAGPLPARVVSDEDWRRAATALESGEGFLLGLWAGAGAVYMALAARDNAKIGLLALQTSGRFPSVGQHYPAAQRLERAIRDLHGFIPENAPDNRPWLDHGRWGVSQPLGNPASATGSKPYVFLPVEGESLHQVPVGPVHAGIIEPGHFRFTAQGETVVRLEERLGYVHKGIAWLMRGATYARGAQLAGRVSGDSTVAYAWAYAQAIEAALGVEPPRRAVILRAVMAELERLANHLGDIGAICNDAAYAMMLAHCGILREDVLRAADTTLGHRLMRDIIVPGGVARDLDDRAVATLRAVVERIQNRFPAIVSLYDNAASLLDRTVGTGCLARELAASFGAGGFVGRASGRDFDTRRDIPYAPYEELDFKVPLRADGDVNARIWIRIEEVFQSLGLISQMLEMLPNGPILTDLPSVTDATCGLGLVEGFRGDILVWIAIEGGKIAECHLRDPSWFQWPLLEAVIEGNIIADFPLCNKSFNCSYSGHDM